MCYVIFYLHHFFTFTLFHLRITNSTCTCVCFDGECFTVVKILRLYLSTASANTRAREMCLREWLLKANMHFVFRSVICFLSSLEVTFTAMVLWNKHFQVLYPNFRPRQTRLDLKAVPCLSTTQSIKLTHMWRQWINNPKQHLCNTLRGLKKPCSFIYFIVHLNSFYIL